MGWTQLSNTTSDLPAEQLQGSTWSKQGSTAGWGQGMALLSRVQPT